MTDADRYSNPERYAERRIAKRYRAAIQKRGLCSACVHRDRDNRTVFGMNCCEIGKDRIHPQCENDGKPKRFVFDPEVLGEFKDAA